jgi:hypothetical protein
LRGLEQVPDVVHLGHVGLDRDGFGAELVDALHHCAGGRAVGGVVDDDVGAEARVPFGDGLADAPG